MSLKKLVTFAGALLVSVTAFACPSDLSAEANLSPAGIIVRCIEGAKTRVWLAAERITHPEIGEALGKKRKEGVEVKVLMETPPNAPKYSMGTYLKKHDVAVYYFDRSARNDKNFIVIDNKYVLDFDSEFQGPRNWSKESLGTKGPAIPSVDPRVRLSEDEKRITSFGDRFRSFSSEVKPL